MASAARWLVLSQLVTAALAVNEFVIPGWDLQSKGRVGDSLANLASTKYDSSSWYYVPSRSTVFGGLISTGVYDDEQLFFSTNLQDTVDYLPYYSPWLYRATFDLDPSKGTHVFLQTNGIASKADIYLNGHLLADHHVQVGAYGGRTYDVTNLTTAENAIAIQAYPTLYNNDFGLGWVDWNPYPPDNGTGIWRNVTVKQTGPVSVGPLRVVHDYVPGAKSVMVQLKADLTNFETGTVSGVMEGGITDPSGKVMKSSQKFSLAPMQTKTAIATIKIQNPEIWWPSQWGDQPLYTAQVSVSSAGVVSDQTAPTAFGIRHITSALSAHKDTIFTVNGHPFQVRGGGYAPDLFLRWDAATFTTQAQYTLDMGLNTIRLEGKEGQPEMFDIADQLGLMVLPGWECCDKWEAWKYNDEVTASLWSDDDYDTARIAMKNEAAMLQAHPSVLGFLVGSDYWPDDRAAAIYVDALHALDWPNPIVASASERGFPAILGRSGMKMTGPYDWVPPNYWYYERVGAAFGFGSELGAGVGTPEIGSLQRFLTDDEMNALWKHPHQGLYHQNTNSSPFHNRKIYNDALFGRYGAPTDLTDYLLKAQLMDYEATRAEFEAYQAKWNAEPRPATGLIYWMLNNAWPGLHWNLFDYYLHPGGAYFGAKTGSRAEHVAFSYDEASVYIINHSLDAAGPRTVQIELIDLHGRVLAAHNLTVHTRPNTSRNISSVPGLERIKDVAFLRLVLSDPGAAANTTAPPLSRNVYWLSRQRDVLDWKRSNWYTTHTTRYADFTGLAGLRPADLDVAVASSPPSSYTGAAEGVAGAVTLTNRADVPAFFVRLNLVDAASGKDRVPVLWEDNYVTLWPGEALVVQVGGVGLQGAAVEVSGWNVKDQTVGF